MEDTHEPGLSDAEIKIKNVSFSAGRLKYYVGCCKAITSDLIILNWIDGFEIPFHLPVFQETLPYNVNWSGTEIRLLKDQINKLLKKGAMSKCNHSKGEFISPIFLTPKPDGSSRLILNLKDLNEFISPPHFKLEDVRTAKILMSNNCYFATIDLKDAFYLVPIAQKHRKYLRFVFSESLYEFIVLPFALNCAPFLFTKIMKPVTSYLINLGFLSVVYLDDWLLICHSYVSCARNVKATTELLLSLGFIVNSEKSLMTPIQICRFLGLELDSQNMLIRLPRDKQVNTKKLVEKFMNLKHSKIRDFASSIGTLGFCCQASTYGWVYVKELEIEKDRALENNNNKNECF